MLLAVGRVFPPLLTPRRRPPPHTAQAAIPRADLVNQLSAAGKLGDVLAAYASNVQQIFPVADATVLSSGGRARTAALEDVGSLAGEPHMAPCPSLRPRQQPSTARSTLPLRCNAGMIRRHKTAPAVRDIEQLPVVTRPATTNVLARATSGNLVTAPSSAVQPAESIRSSMPGSPTNGSVPASPRPASSATQPNGKQAASAVAVTASAGPSAAATAAASSPSPSPAAAKAAVQKPAVPAVTSEAGAPQQQELSLREKSMLRQQMDVVAPGQRAINKPLRLSWPVAGPS
jgi:hypothetical protein